MGIHLNFWSLYLRHLTHHELILNSKVMNYNINAILSKVFVKITRISIFHRWTLLRWRVISCHPSSSLKVISSRGTLDQLPPHLVRWFWESGLPQPGTGQFRSPNLVSKRPFLLVFTLSSPTWSKKTALASIFGRLKNEDYVVSRAKIHSGDQIQD